MRLLALLTLSMWSNAAIADEGRFTFLGLNQCAPFEGILFDPAATANVLAEVQTAKEEKEPLTFGSLGTERKPAPTREWWVG